MTTLTTAETTSSTVAFQLQAISQQLDDVRAELDEQRAARRIWTDLLADAGPIASEAMGHATTYLAATDVEGALSFGRGAAQVVGKVVSAFDEDDLHALGDNIVLMLETLREMTQPEVMTLLRRTATVVRDHPAEPVDPPSTLGLLRELRDPEVRRGLARMLDLLRSVGDDAPIDLTDHDQTQEVAR